MTPNGKEGIPKFMITRPAYEVSKLRQEEYKNSGSSNSSIRDELKFEKIEKGEIPKFIMPKMG